MEAARTGRSDSSPRRRVCRRRGDRKRANRDRNDARAELTRADGAASFCGCFNFSEPGAQFIMNANKAPVEVREYVRIAIAAFGHDKDNFRSPTRLTRQQR
jgi:hypothetical protein